MICTFRAHNWVEKDEGDKVEGQKEVIKDRRCVCNTGKKEIYSDEGRKFQTEHCLKRLSVTPKIARKNE